MEHWLDNIGTVKAKKRGNGKHKPAKHAAVKQPAKDVQPDPAADEDNTTGKAAGWFLGGLLVLIMIKGVKEVLR